MIKNLIIAALALAVGAGGAVAAEGKAGVRHRIPIYLDRPCPQEDSLNCYWDAHSAGNHRGHSFFTFSTHGGVGAECIVYIARADRHWNNCQ